MNTDPSPPRPTEQQLIAAIAALDPEARERVERVLDAQLENGAMEPFDPDWEFEELVLHLNDTYVSLPNIVHGDRDLKPRTI